MSDIAARAGVSRATVSFVLSGRHTDMRIGEETRRRVLSAAAELNYLPSSSARATRRGKTGCVAFLLADEGHKRFLPFSLLAGIQRALAEQDLHLALATPPDTKLADAGYVPKMLREWMADGMLINYLIGIPEGLIELARNHRVPSVWINVRQKVDCVHPDDWDAGVRATERLLALGHQRIAYLDYSFGSNTEPALVHYSTRDREAGYRQAMQAVGLAPRVIRGANSLPRGEHVGFTRTWLEAPDRPTAVIAYTTDAALAVLHAAMAYAHLRVPQDLSLITFHDRMLDSLGVPIDTLLLPEEAIGQAAVSLLVKKMAEPERLLAPTVIPLGFAEGASCGPPPPV